MKKGKKFIIIVALIIIIIILLLLFVRLTGFVVTGTAVDTCSDTDFGKEYWEKGKVYGDSYLFVKESFDEEDFCKNDKTLIEYSCRNKNIHSYLEKTEYDCPRGCFDGKCLGQKIEVPDKVTFFTKIKEFFLR